jgi:hypothetical protein
MLFLIESYGITVMIIMDTHFDRQICTQMRKLRIKPETPILILRYAGLCQDKRIIRFQIADFPAVCMVLLYSLYGHEVYH